MPVDNYTNLYNYNQRKVPLNDIIDQVLKAYNNLDKELFNMRQTTPDTKPSVNDEIGEAEKYVKGYKEEPPAVSRIAIPPGQKRTGDIRFRWKEEETIKLIKERNNDYYFTLFERNKNNS